MHTRTHHVARWAHALAKAYRCRMPYVCYAAVTSWTASHQPDGVICLRATRDEAGRPAIRLSDFYQLESLCAAISATSN